MGIHCLHCGREVAEGKAKLIFSAVLCSDCGAIATRLHHRLEQGLVATKQVLAPVMQRAIINKSLGYETLQEVEDASLASLLKLLIAWMETCQSPTATEDSSSTTSKPHALTAGESVSSPSSTGTASE